LLFFSVREDYQNPSQEIVIKPSLDYHKLIAEVTMTSFI